MTELEQDREDVSEVAVAASTFVVLSAIALSVLAVWTFTRSVRGHVRLQTEDVHWWKAVPESVHGVELRSLQEETASERAVRAARVRLASYGWADREQGRVHVPIDVAMELYLAGQDGR
jgi:hypothetical protein